MKQQISLFDITATKDIKKRFARMAHGGGLNKDKRKIERPLATKRPMHVTLHAQQAKGAWSFLNFKNRTEVEAIIRRQARRHGVTIQDYANAGNHLHIKTKASRRAGFQNFLRSTTSLIARFVTKARRGHKLAKKFWDELAFTRVLKSYREEIHLRGYFIANRQEASRGHGARERFLGLFRKWVAETYQRPAANSS